MRDRLLAGLSAALLLCGVAVAAAPAANAQGERRDYIVVYKQTVEPSAKTTALERAHRFTSTLVYRHAIRGFAASLTDRERAAVENDPAVAFVAEDRPVRTTAPDNAIRAKETVPTGVRRMGGAAGPLAHRNSGVAVAVIDTGVSTGTRDLNVRSGRNCVPPGIGSASDRNGHGTHVAGTIGASNNNRGVIGVAPGTRLYSVRVLDASGSGSISTVICGLDWVAQNAAKRNIKVANMSLGGPGANGGGCGQNTGDPLHMAVCRVTQAGVTIVAAAGNEGRDLAGSTPAAYPEVLTVTAMSDSDGAAGATGAAPACRGGQPDDGPASFSNFAVSEQDRAHTVAAPGVCIDSTWLGRARNTISGTSMAAPHVAAAVALCIKHGSTNGPCAGMGPAQIIAKIRADAAAQPSGYGFDGDPNNPVAGRYYGHLVYAGDY